MLRVDRYGPTRGGDGWPPGPPVTEIWFGITRVLTIDSDEAVADLIAKLQAALDGAKRSGR